MRDNTSMSTRYRSQELNSACVNERSCRIWGRKPIRGLKEAIVSNPLDCLELIMKRKQHWAIYLVAAE